MKEENKKEIYNEAKIMKKLFHPNVISFKDVFKDTKLDYFYIVMEYADDGDLSKKIKQQQNKINKDKYFTEDKIIKYFYQICKGIEYIHSKNVIHRDIKSQNIFLMKNGTIKIGDFGIAKALTNTKSNAITIIGTPYYFSPEIINGEPYNYKTDIWSLGIVLYEMCNLKLPFDSNNIAQLSMKILRGNYDPIPFKYSKEMHNIVKRMLNVDQNKRPDIKEIMRSPLLQNINLSCNNKRIANIKKKNWSNNNQKSANINSTASNFNCKMNDEPFIDQKKKERKSLINKKVNKDKSVSPIKFKNKSFMVKAGLMKKNNDNSESSIELPKKSDKVKTKKSFAFKRNISQKNIEIKTYRKEEKEEKYENKIINNNNNNNINNNQNQKIKNINNIDSININNMNNIKSINIDNINSVNKININNMNNFNKPIDNMYIINNLENKNNNIANIDSNKPNNNNNSTKKSNNKVDNIINSTNNNINNNKIKNNINSNISNNKPIINLNKNLFYDGNFKNKDEIINRSNAFDVNFSGKSILFDKEKTINLLNGEEEKNKNIINPFNDKINLNKDNILFKNIYNFNEQTIKMFTLKEEDNEKETIKSNNNLYNGDIDNLNFIIQKNTTKTNDNNTQSDCVNYLTKEKNDENFLKVDLDFEIINNSMNIEEIKDNQEKEEKLKNEKKFDFEEYIKTKIGEKMYFIIKEYLIEINIEQIVNYSCEKMINQLKEILEKKKFREREIKNAEKYLFDIFFIIINGNQN